MFQIEQGFLSCAKKYGKQTAVELSADINQYTRLHTPKEPSTEETAKPSLLSKRTLLDYNEHFIELSNGREELRALFFMLALLTFVVMPAIPIFGFCDSISEDIRTGRWFVDIVFFGGLTIAVLVICNVLWPLAGAPVIFTALRARYRFNRATRKVYVLRPRRYGGNVVLDWDRVQAHVSWRPRREMTYDQLRDPGARQMRQNNTDDASLVLYWPPLDSNDPERQGEEILWVGSEVFFGKFLWQYIRTFMEEGIDAVPVPNEFEWLRKGYSNPSQNLQEVAMHPFLVRDACEGRSSPSASTSVGFLAQFLWTPFHSMGERFCYWPTFPEEWGSDCGLRRRESGLGPEEPLRWTGK